MRDVHYNATDRPEQERHPRDRALSSVELRHLRGFVAVAEERSFTRAAVRLSLTQPALSRTIAQFEQLLGVALLHRTRQVVELTAAGQRFLPAAKRALAVVEDALRSATEEVPPLRVGFTYGGALPFIAPIVKAFERAHPTASVELLRVDDRLAGLSDGRSHIAFLPMAPDDPAIETAIVAQESRVAAIPADHPLARRRSLRLRDLRSEKLVMNIVSGTTRLDLWPPGEAPRSIVEVRNVEEWLEAIAAGRGIGMTPAATGRVYTHPQIRYVPIVDAPAVQIVMAWPANAIHPLNESFVAVAARADG
jgi:DNA-binding transcriptional LysR family regulator